jgi:UDP-glucose 4-epimerase
VDARATFAAEDIRHAEATARLLREHAVDCVMHFAALAYVGESMRDPLSYYDVNDGGTLRLLQAMTEAGVDRIVFSSTCATYGQPEQMPITEDTVKAPLSPYGRSKLMDEHMIEDCAHTIEGFSCAFLRYFNVAGCAPEGDLGEDHDPETHLIPVLLLTALGRREGMTIHGEDYPTRDGTCVRDYLHVEDLVAAHIRVMEALAPGDRRVYNLGLGRGHTVREVLESARRVTGAEIPAETGPRRSGDPPELYADASAIARDLGWQPQYRELDEIVRTAWAWFRDHPDGYGDR